ncbi:serine protease inhibitor [Ramaria rubella]|nr:serine protease inhibitor [Ramaria rubella]
MTDLKLPTGRYTIFNGKDHASRQVAEDNSLQHGVFCPTDSRTNSWQIEALPNGRYRLTMGDPTVVIKGLLYALIRNSDQAEEWVITERKNEGPSLYTIETASKDAGWIAQKDEKHNQLAQAGAIAVRPLTVSPGDPPVFPPNELWNIRPLVE